MEVRENKPLNINIENMKATLESLLLEGLPDEYLASQLSALKSSNQIFNETLTTLQQRVIPISNFI
jgi:hypothetical protein